MWIATNKGFLSIVEDRHSPTVLLVRARAKGHIEDMFPMAQVRCTPDADYRYRASVDRDVVARAVEDAVRRIDYTNFKNSVGDADLHEAYFDVWSAMHTYQMVSRLKERKSGNEVKAHVGKTTAKRRGGKARRAEDQVR